jgi:phage terminase large subunit-like protein
LPSIAKSKNIAEQYAFDVLDDRINVGRLVRLAVERDLHDQRTGHRRNLVFDRSAAELTLEWYPICKHYEGEFEGQPLILSPWQAWVEWVSFGWKKKTTGYRRFQERWIEVAAGNGKSTWMGADALLMLVGDDEAGAAVYSAATKQEQAKIVWEAANHMIQQSEEELKPLLKVFDSVNNHRIVYPGRNAFFVPLSKEARSAEGLKPHAVICDEVHEFTNRKLYDILKAKMAKRRQPMFTNITTAGDDEPETIYEEVHDYAESILEGWHNDNFIDDFFFAFIAAIDDHDDPYEKDIDEDQVIEMLEKANPNLGVSIQLDTVMSDWKRGWKVPAAQSSALRYHFNRRCSTAVRAIALETWDEVADRSIEWEFFDDYPCMGAFDLSSTLDLTAITLYWPYHGMHFYRFFTFLPEDMLKVKCKSDMVPYDLWVKQGWLELTPGNQIDDETIIDRIFSLNESLNVVQWTHDPYHSAFISNVLQRKYGIECIKFRQDLASFAEPTMMFLDELYAGVTVHDGNPLARWCAGNVVTKEDSQANRIPHKKASKKRIDTIMAAIMARARAIVVDMDDYEPKSAYEDRGMISA